MLPSPPRRVLAYAMRALDGIQGELHGVFTTMVDIATRDAASVEALPGESDWLLSLSYVRAAGAVPCWLDVAQLHV